jgi:hypothetical protein
MSAARREILTLFQAEPLQHPGLELLISVRSPMNPIPRNIPQPLDLPHQLAAMPANPQMNPHLYTIREVEIFHTIGVDQFRNLAAVHYVDHRHPFPFMHSRRR